MGKRILLKHLALGLIASCASIAWGQAAITDPPLEHHYGKIPLGATYATQYFSVFNQGAQPVTLGQASVNAGIATCAALGCPVVSSADFVLGTGGSDGCSGRTLAPGEGCSTLVSFVPQSPGARVAQLTFLVQGGLPLNRTLAGTGVTQPFDCVVDWAERTLPASLVAQPTPTMVVGPFFARCYQGGVLCVAADSAATTVAPASVYAYQGGRLTSLATLASLAMQATHPHPSTRRCDQPIEGQ